jgi:hypothetical protein
MTPVGAAALGLAIGVIGPLTKNHVGVCESRRGLSGLINPIDSYYKLMPGVCPWWDGVARGEAAE